MEDELQQVKAMLRSVLLSSKEGVTEECFLEDYQSVTGELLPFKKFGYTSQSSFIESLPDVVHIRRNKFGETVYHAVADETTAHIQRLVSKQKSKKTKGPHRGLTSVRHSTKPFTGRGGYTHSQGRPPVSSWSAPSMRGGFEHRRGRGSAARGYPVRGRTPHLSPPRGRTPFSDIKQSLDSNNDTEWTAPSTHSRFKHKRGRGSAARGGYPVRGRTPFSDTTQSQYSNDDTEIWEMEDIENIDNNLGNDQSDNWNDQPIPLMDIKITFNVNNSSSSHRYDSAKGNRKVRSVRHLTKPFRGRGDYTHSRGRPPVSSWSAPSVHSGGFEHKGGRWSAPRGGCSEWGRIPLLRTPTEKAPCFTNPRERTPFRHMRWCQQMAIDHSYLPIYM